VISRTLRNSSASKAFFLMGCSFSMGIMKKSL
jgi:hypothetical protein